MSVDFTPEELRKESNAELQRRMNTYRPESGAYMAAKAEWDRRINAAKVRREWAKIIVSLLFVAVTAAGIIAKCTPD